MKKAIIVSGSVGAGKTTFAKKLAGKLKAEYVDVNSLVEEYKLSKSYDKKRKSKIVDADRLNKVLIGIIKKSKRKTVVITIYFSSFKKLCLFQTKGIDISKKPSAKNDSPPKP